MVVLAVAMGAGFAYLYLVEYLGYAKPAAPAVPAVAPVIDVAAVPSSDEAPPAVEPG